MAPLSKFIRNIADEIELKSGAKIKFAQITMGPTEKWISERDMSKMKALQLRTAEDIKNKSVVELQQFNPSFFLKDPRDIHCRFPECSATIQRLKPTRSSEKIKQDLFLCCAHRERLISEVTKRCAEENVIINIASFKKEDFNGYTSLIGILEKAFTHFQKQASILNTTNSLLAEVFLNTRNFLIITNALLNPNEDNTATVLAPCMMVFRMFLAYIEDPQRRQSLVTALREIMNMIFQFFGVMYSWVFLGNPGSQVGGGLGLALGFVGGAAFAFFPPGIFAAAVVGLVAGNLIGRGGYNWYSDHHYIKMQQEMVVQQYQEFLFRMFGQPGTVTQQPRLFCLPANADGDMLIKMEQD